MVYDTDEGYIMDSVSGQKVRLDHEKGVFQYGVWVVPYEMI